MANRADCMQSLQNAGLSAQEAQAVVDSIERQVSGGRPQGTVNPQQAAANLIKKQAENARRKALIQKRQAALNIVKRDQLNSYIAQVQAEGGTALDALNARLVGSGKNLTGGRESAARTGTSLRALWAGSLAKELDELDVVPLLKKDRTFGDQVMIEMIEPGKTGDKLARQTADVFSRHLEEWRLRCNEAGADIGKLRNYAPQSHDSLKLRRAGMKEWIDYISPRLDWEKTFPDTDPKKIPDILAEIYQEITTGIRAADSVREDSPFRFPGSMANNLAKERSLFFKDGQAAIEYQQRFSDGTIVDAVLRRLDSSAKKVGLMQTFGPNPEFMIQSILKEQLQTVRDNPALADQMQRAWRPDKTGWLANRYKVLAGEAGTPENITAARIGSFARGITSMAKLGGAVLSSFADIGLKLAAARHSGESWLGQWRNAFTMRFQRFQGEDRVELGRSLGVYVNGLLGEIYNRFDATDAVNGTMSRWMNTFFRLSGLEGWTEAHKAAYAYYTSNRLARNADTDFARLNPDYRRVLEKEGMADYWPLMKLLAEDVEGERYIVPQNAMNLPESELVRYLPIELQNPPIAANPAGLADWQQARTNGLNRIRRDVQTKVMGYIADETSYAVLEPDAKVRASMYQGTKPGTVAGEILRFALQFKAFPITYLQRIMNESRWQRASKQTVGGYSGLFDRHRITDDVPGIVQFFLITTVLGYISMMCKDLTKGRTPRDITHNPTGVTVAAILQGGGLGIIGDFLMGETDRFGNQAAANLAGPFLTNATKIFQATGNMFQGEFGAAGEIGVRAAWDNTPFINLWYTRAALDYLIQYHLREMMSPGTLRKAERKMKKEMNQTYLKIGGLDLTPSKIVKRGGGFR